MLAEEETPSDLGQSCQPQPLPDTAEEATSLNGASADLKSPESRVGDDLDKTPRRGCCSSCSRRLVRPCFVWKACIIRPIAAILLGLSIFSFTLAWSSLESARAYERREIAAVEFGGLGYDCGCYTWCELNMDEVQATISAGMTAKPHYASSSARYVDGDAKDKFWKMRQDMNRCYDPTSDEFDQGAHCLVFLREFQNYFHSYPVTDHHRYEGFQCSYADLREPDICHQCKELSSTPYCTFDTVSDACISPKDAVETRCESESLTNCTFGEFEKSVEFHKAARRRKWWTSYLVLEFLVAAVAQVLCVLVNVIDVGKASKMLRASCGRALFGSFTIIRLFLLPLLYFVYTFMLLYASWDMGDGLGDPWVSDDFEYAFRCISKAPDAAKAAQCDEATRLTATWRYSTVAFFLFSSAASLLCVWVPMLQIASAADSMLESIPAMPSMICESSPARQVSMTEELRRAKLLRRVAAVNELQAQSCCRRLVWSARHLWFTSMAGPIRSVLVMWTTASLCIWQLLRLSYAVLSVIQATDSNEPKEAASSQLRHYSAPFAFTMFVVSCTTVYCACFGVLCRSIRYYRLRIRVSTIQNAYAFIVPYIWLIIIISFSLFITCMIVAGAVQGFRAACLNLDRGVSLSVLAAGSLYNRLQQQMDLATTMADKTAESLAYNLTDYYQMVCKASTLEHGGNFERALCPTFEAVLNDMNASALVQTFVLEMAMATIHEGIDWANRTIIDSTLGEFERTRCLDFSALGSPVRVCNKELRNMCNEILSNETHAHAAFGFSLVFFAASCILLAQMYAGYILVREKDFYHSTSNALFQMIGTRLKQIAQRTDLSQEAICSEVELVAKAVLQALNAEKKPTSANAAIQQKPLPAVAEGNGVAEPVGEEIVEMVRV